MAFETEGIVHKIFETEKKTETFRAREFVIKQGDQYPQFIKFQLTQDRCDILDSCKEGDKLKVHFDLKGREWNDKYFTNLNAWKVEKVSTENSVQQAPVGDDGFQAIEKSSSEIYGAQEKGADDFDDLPF